uniref:Histidinol-phosphate aminotransferase n=1 Tax=Thermosporothrix sp. COM3 TaxID=2490863 RepID=A0A455SV97_9CHLR|nr:histidinol-phosphate aminotransferase [Thermosporothrix sp. COM3]
MMYTYSPRLVSVRPELDRLAEYVPGESLEAFSTRTNIPIQEIIKLNSNESPYEPVPEVLAALANYKQFNLYPDTDSAALRQALEQYTGVEKRHIVVQHGSMELINLLWHLFLSPGDNIICCPPTFSLYKSVTTFCGAHVVEVPRNPDFSLNVEAIKAAITPQTKLIILCSPNNPTGNPIRQEDLFALLDTGRIIMVDEAYVEFSDFPRGYAHLVPEHENLVVTRTFSKWAGLAGLRIGYALVPEWIQSYMRRAQCPFEVNMSGHIAAIETLKHLDATLQNVQRIVEERAHLFEVLASYPFLKPLPSQGNYILTFVDQSQVTIKQLRNAVESHGILLRYFSSQPDLADYFRVTVGLPEHTEKLNQALQGL